MSNTPPTLVRELPHKHYLNATYGAGLRSWLLTTDHKRIALLYLASVTVFFFIGGVLATLIRIHLLTPGGALVTPETYNKLFTMHTMRAPGMTWFRMPLFVWAHYATSLVMILGTPVVAITLLLAGLERMFHLGFFNPALGGDPILFQHLFWFYSHPAVYIMILPAMGVISEIIPTFARKPIFGYSFIAGSSIAIAVIGFLVWAHHMFVTGESTYAALTFSFLSYLVAIPSAVKVFNWTSTLYKGSISLDPPTVSALGFIGLFVIGGLTRLFLARPR